MTDTTVPDGPRPYDDPPMAAIDIAKMFGVTHAAVSQWVAAERFPQPDDVVATRPVWRTSTVKRAGRPKRKSLSQRRTWTKNRKGIPVKVAKESNNA